MLDYKNFVSHQHAQAGGTISDSHGSHNVPGHAINMHHALTAGGYTRTGVSHTASSTTHTYTHANPTKPIIKISHDTDERHHSNGASWEVHSGKTASQHPWGRGGHEGMSQLVHHIANTHKSI